MKVLKVIELLAASNSSWEDAAKNAIKEANKTLKGIKSINIQNMNATVKDGEIDEFRVNAKVTFEVKA